MARRFTTRKSFSEIGQLGLSELRKEYTTLRDIFQKRISRAVRAGIAEAKVYLPGEWAYVPTLKEIKNLGITNTLSAAEQRRDLEFRVKELTRLVGERERGLPAAGTLSVTGKTRQRKERDTGVLKALHAGGYEHISKSTLKNFGRFMDQMRKQYGKKLPNSAEMAEMFDKLKYNTKRRSTQFIVDLWEEYKRNGYEPDDGSVDLFAR